MWACSEFGEQSGGDFQVLRWLPVHRKAWPAIHVATVQLRAKKKTLNNPRGSIPTLRSTLPHQSNFLAAYVLSTKFLEHKESKQFILNIVNQGFEVHDHEVCRMRIPYHSLLFEFTAKPLVYRVPLELVQLQYLGFF